MTVLLISTSQRAGIKWAPRNVSSSPEALRERLIDSGVNREDCPSPGLHLAVRGLGSRCPNLISQPCCHILFETIRVDHLIRVMYLICDYYLSHYMKPKTSKSTLISQFLILTEILYFSLWNSWWVYSRGPELAKSQYGTMQFQRYALLPVWALQAKACGLVD